jgi:RHS repeat-associated protein
VLDYFGYTHDLTGLRTNVVRADNTHVEYLFDGIGQLTNAIAYEPGGGLRKNENFAYAYDQGGNLKTRVNNTLTQGFGVDNANRLTSATRSGTLTIAGSVNSLAQSVTVNSVGAELYVDKTFATTNGLTLNNGNNSLTFSAKNAANQTTSYTKNFNLPANVNYTYDLNGNLISDGSLGYDYDDADQLRRITKTNAWKSEFAYDALGRRNVRREYTWNSGPGTWNLTDEVRYVWVGMSLLQERDSNNAVKVTYTGKLARTDANGTAYYFSDGNRNITSLVDSSGNFKAKYRYDSFGNLLSMSGSLADANLIRFSGKEYHPRSGLYYYCFRYYQPNLQRWLNEDPIGLTGGLNLYGFVGNNPIGLVDMYGLAWAPSDLGHSWGDSVAEGGEILSSDGTGAGAIAWNTVVYAVSGLGESIPDLLNCGEDVGSTSGDPNATAKDWAKAGFKDGLRAVGIATAASGPVSRSVGAAGKALGLEAKAGAGVAGEIAAPVSQAEKALPNGSSAAAADASALADLNAAAKATPEAPATCSPGACFVAGTVVASEDGLKPIEEIKVGERVWAADERTGEVALKEVLETMSHDDFELVQIELGDVTIRATTEHPFWVESAGWTFASKLKPGDMVRTLNGKEQVSKVERLRRASRVFNFEVAGFHTYFVSSALVLVHNNGNSVTPLAPWSNKNVSQVAKEIQGGAKNVTVASRSQAEEIFLGLFQGKGYSNTTGMTGKQVRESLPNGKYGTYHWDTADTMHGGQSHLQIHTEQGDIIRVFFP